MPVGQILKVRFDRCRQIRGCQFAEAGIDDFRCESARTGLTGYFSQVASAWTSL